MLSDFFVPGQLRTILYLNNYFEVSGLRSFEGVVDHFFNVRYLKNSRTYLYKNQSSLIKFLVVDETRAKSFL